MCTSRSHSQLDYTITWYNKCQLLFYFFENTFLRVQNQYNSNEQNRVVLIDQIQYHAPMYKLIELASPRCHY